MRLRLFASIYAPLLVVPAIAAAQPPASAAAEPAVGVAVEAGSAAKHEATAETRRDPRGLKGISPFTEALKRGDSAVLARDFDGAIAAYKDALARESENALAYYRIAEAQLLKGDMHEAETALTAGLHVVAVANVGLKAKLQFLLADVRERQKAYDEASSAWTEYEAFTTAHQDAQGFPASGAERKKAVETWKRLSADSAAVKARIEKGMKAADEAVRKSSK
jgi:tetratricopeptide (TPR) repeat protein